MRSIDFALVVFAEDLLAFLAELFFALEGFFCPSTLLVGSLTAFLPAELDFGFDAGDLVTAGLISVHAN